MPPAAVISPMGKAGLLPFPKCPLTEERFQSNQTPNKIIKIDDELVICKASHDDLVEFTGQLET